MKRKFTFLFLLTVLVSPVSLKGQDLSGISVGIDPGHGGGNKNHGPTGLLEHVINMEVSRFLKGYLKSAGIDTVLLTRKDSTENPSLSEREDIANNFGVTWFHSVHQNATGWSQNLTVRYTLVLYEEKAGYVPEWPGESDVMSHYMARNLYNALRTQYYRVSGDYSFYGTPSYLGVLNDLTMPGELSEATFHDHPVEEAKMRNPDFLKMEARGLYHSFLEYYEAGTTTEGPLIGIIKDADTNNPINGPAVTLKPLNIQYTVDNNNNGLYIFDKLEEEIYTVSVSMDGYEQSEDTISVHPHRFNFRDFKLISTVPPFVVYTDPESGTTDFNVFRDIKIGFSRSMDRDSFSDNFRIYPEKDGIFKWSSDLRTVSFNPGGPLLYDTLYTVTLSGEITDVHGHPLDGNGDGIGGDPYSFTFSTQTLDMSKPVVILTYPQESDTGVFIGSVISAAFNKHLDTATVVEDNFLILDKNYQRVRGRIEYAEFEDKSKITLIPKVNLRSGVKYFVTLLKSIADADGNQMDEHFQWNFTTEKRRRYTYILDEVNTMEMWENPLNSPETRGIKPDSLIFELRNDYWISGGVSVGVSYQFNDPTGVLFIRWKKGDEDTLSHVSDADGISLYIFGDGSYNDITFFFKSQEDSILSPDPIPVEWQGWKPVVYYLQNSGENLRFMGFSISYSSSLRGDIHFDRLLKITNTPITSVKEPQISDKLPLDFVLEQNFPNPFNSTTVIKFTVPPPNYGEMGTVKVSLNIYNIKGELVRNVYSGYLKPGTHRFYWNGKGRYGKTSPSGIYIYAIKSGEKSISKKMLLIR